MARWNARERQRMVEEYLNATGANYFVPRDFLSWLMPQEDHPMHGYFFGKSDAELAQAMREDMVRQWVSGLRIVVREQPSDPIKVSVVVHEMPALVSPVSGRRGGGGYMPMDPSDPAMIAELLRQAVASLDTWLERYGGIAATVGADVTPIREIAAFLAGGVVQSAA